MNPVFDLFQRSEPRDEAGFHINFMGAKSRIAWEKDLPFFIPTKSSGRSPLYVEGANLPHPQTEDYHEWVDMLTAIVRAKDTFRMVEAGAGYGRWTVNAACALRRFRGPHCSGSLTAIEASSNRFNMLRQNLEDNLTIASVHNAALTGEGSAVWITVDDDFGTPVTEKAGQTSEKVEALRLSKFLDAGWTDFLDIDIQGCELEVLLEAERALDSVGIVHVGTHSGLIHNELGEMFAGMGWSRRFSLWPLQFIDGIQSWENPRSAGWFMGR
jgi:FkbM family methyltransferase